MDYSPCRKVVPSLPKIFQVCVWESVKGNLQVIVKPWPLSQNRARAATSGEGCLTGDEHFGSSMAGIQLMKVGSQGNKCLNLPITPAS